MDRRLGSHKVFGRQCFTASKRINNAIHVERSRWRIRVYARSYSKDPPSLFSAIRDNNIGLVNALIEEGASVNSSFHDGWTALHETAQSKNLFMMQRLISLGANCFATDVWHTTPLMIAVQRNFVDGVELLLATAGENASKLADMTRNDGLSCLMIAASCGFTQILQLLIKHGANCNVIWNSSRSDVGRIHPLAAAARCSFPKCVELLIPHVDEQALRNTDVDPLLAAASIGAHKCVRLLLDAGYPAEVAECGSFLETSEMPHGRPTHRSPPCYTPLLEAVRKGHCNIVLELIKAGARMTYTNRYFSPFLNVFRFRVASRMLYIFLKNDVNMNVTSYGRNYYVPDLLISVLNLREPMRDKYLPVVLRCGLNPSLKYLCKCKSPRSMISDMRERRLEITAVLKLLVLFSPGIPNCCNELANAIDAKPEVPKLLHLCRLAIRRCFSTSMLLNGRFMDYLPLPNSLRDYMTFEHLPKQFTS